MTIEEIIKHLEVFPKDWEVLITDCFKCNYYKGDYKILPWEDDDGKMCIEIGIDEYDEDDESEEYDDGKMCIEIGIDEYDEYDE